MVFAGRVHTIPWQQARPSKGHDPPQLVAVALVARVVDVRRSLLDQQREETQKLNLDGIGSGIRLVWINNPKQRVS